MNKMVNKADQGSGQYPGFNLKNTGRAISKFYYSLTLVLSWLGHISLAAIIVIVFVDVTGRYFFHHPIKDSYGLVLLAMYILGGFGIMYTAVEGGHIAIDLLVGKWKKNAQEMVKRVTAFLGFACWGLLGYCAIMVSKRHSTLTTDSLHIPVRPFEIILGIAAFFCAAVLLIQIFQPERPVKPEEKEAGEGEL